MLLHLSCTSPLCNYILEWFLLGFLNSFPVTFMSLNLGMCRQNISSVGNCSRCWCAGKSSRWGSWTRVPLYGGDGAEKIVFIFFFICFYLSRLFISSQFLCFTLPLHLPKWRNKTNGEGEQTHPCALGELLVSPALISTGSLASLSWNNRKQWKRAILSDSKLMNYLST